MTHPAHRTYTSLDPEGEAAVGRVAIWAAWLEQELAYLVSEIIDGVNGVGHIVTNDLMASKLIDLSKSLLRNEYGDIPQNLRDDTTDALVRASLALKQRNQILHGVVGGTLIPGSTAFHNRKRPGNAHFYTAAELDVVGEQLHASMTEIQDCTAAIFLHRRADIPGK